MWKGGYLGAEELAWYALTFSLLQISSAWLSMTDLHYISYKIIVLHSESKALLVSVELSWLKMAKDTGL